MARVGGAPHGHHRLPFHGWEGQQVLGSHTAYIEEVKATEGDVPITACLHWNEYDNPKVRREYEDAGVRVVTHGQRGYLWQDTDVAFLYRQLHEMRGHRRVVSNRMSSAILYAASAGVEVGVYGDPMALESDHAVLGGVGKPRRIWPEMHQFSVPMDYAAAVANAELGADELLLPEEIIDVFGWAAEIERPLPPPSAPPLDEELSVFQRRRRRKHRADSHRAPSEANHADLLESRARPADDEASTDTGRKTVAEDESRGRGGPRVRAVVRGPHGGPGRAAPRRGRRGAGDRAAGRRRLRAQRGRPPSGPGARSVIRGWDGSDEVP